MYRHDFCSFIVLHKYIQMSEDRMKHFVISVLESLFVTSSESLCLVLSKFQIMLLF